MMHKIGMINKDNLNSERSYNTMLSYANSKLANVLFTRELARRLKDTSVSANCLHPGNVKTEISRNMQHHSFIFNHYLNRIFMTLFCKTARAGAQTTIYAGFQEILKFYGLWFQNNVLVVVVLFSSWSRS
jgi:NAD(P)-dependent dehydrogenase (short-subunit alcohol dehydrogenase family)